MMFSRRFFIPLSYFRQISIMTDQEYKEHDTIVSDPEEVVVDTIPAEATQSCLPQYDFSTDKIPVVLAHSSKPFGGCFLKGCTW